MRKSEYQQTNKNISQNYEKPSNNQHLKSDGNEKLLDKPEKSRYTTFQIDGSTVKRSEQTSNYKKQIFFENSQEHCYPKFLDYLGQCISPCLIFCPFWRCHSCCKNTPLFQQPMTNFGLLQRWGSYQKILDPGLHIINPISQQIIQINRQTKSVEFSQIAFSKDNVQFKVDSVVFYRIADSLKLAYKLGSQESQCIQCITEISQACLRNLIGVHTLQNVIEKRQIIGNHLREDLNQNLKIWGIYIQTCALKEIILSEQIRQYLQSTTRAKRLMQSQIINYKAQVQIGKLIKQMSQILSTKAAFQIRYLQTIGQILQKNQNSIIMIKTRME